MFNKLKRNKKGYNDMYLLSGLICIFVFIGFALPYVNASYGRDASTLSSDNIESTAKDNLNNISSISAFSVLLSIAKMFLWTFGDLPVWVDLVIFVPLRLIAYALIARNVWVGGGG